MATSEERFPDETSDSKPLGGDEQEGPSGSRDGKDLSITLLKALSTTVTDLAENLKAVETRLAHLEPRPRGRPRKDGIRASSVSRVAPSIQVLEPTPPPGGDEYSEDLGPRLHDLLNYREDAHRGSRNNGDVRTMPPAKVFELLNRWKVEFSGQREKDVKEFVARIDDALASFPIREEDLLGILRGCLKDTALLWYRGKDFSCWNTARKAFRSRFADLDFQPSLEAEIFTRTQGRYESISEFLSKMDALFSKTIPPWPQSRRLQVVYRNLLPKFRIGLRFDECLTLDELEGMLRRQEKNMECSRSWQPPRRPEESVCLSSAYKEPAGTARDSKPNVVNALDGGELPVDKEEFSEEDPEMLDALGRPKPRGKFGRENRCFNCKQAGHQFRECKEPPTLFCYRCGKVGVTTIDCSRCNPGNASPVV